MQLIKETGPSTFADGELITFYAVANDKGQRLSDWYIDQDSAQRKLESKFWQEHPLSSTRSLSA